MVRDLINEFEAHSIKNVRESKNKQPQAEKTSFNPLIKKEGWGEKSVKNLFEAINQLQDEQDLRSHHYSLIQKA